VILTSAGAVDTAATATERARLAATRRAWPVTADEREAYEGERGKHRVLRVSPALAATLGVATNDLVEMLGRHPAPLRAWVRVDPDAHDGRIALDTLGRRILGVAPDDGVLVRRLSTPPIPGGLVTANAARIRPPSSPHRGA
jgi:N-methylhydantoinase B